MDIQTDIQKKIYPQLKVLKGINTSDGAGVNLRRYFPSFDVEQHDPFLLFDVFKSDNPNDYIAGFPPHPHRGFETVTYLLEGQMQHKDSAGHQGLIKKGGVQWMTAGKGIEHSEMPQQQAGLLYGFQLWINLPAVQKMKSPRYQELEPEMIDEEQREEGVSLRVIAGETSCGTKGAIVDIAAEPIFYDINLSTGKSFSEPIKAGYNILVFVISGEIAIGQQQLNVNELALLGDAAGETIEINARQVSRLLLIAARPFKETIERAGPFVMNSKAELKQAFSDYQQGLFGKIS